MVDTDYQALLLAGPGWRQALARYGFEMALLPVDWPLGAVLENDPEWRLVDRDSSSVLLIRRDAPLKESRETAECKSVGE